MKPIIFSLMIIALIFRCNSQSYIHPQKTDPAFLQESENFMFFNHPWINMHHFIYNAAIRYKETDIEQSIDSIAWGKFGSDEKEITKELLTYYRDSIIIGDLRTGGYNYAFKRWVVQYYWEKTLPSSEYFTKQTSLLNKFKKVYQKYFWDKHSTLNKKVLDTNIELIKKYEREFIERLSKLCKSNWQAQKIRVDISYSSKRNRPYTTVGPTTHIVMDSKRSSIVPGDWLELLLHEASHHLIQSTTGFVGGTIQNTSEVLNIKKPRQLWHSYLFYLSGKVTQNLLKKEGLTNYELYMVRYKVFDWMFPYLDLHLPQYIGNKISLSEATENIFTDFNNNR